MDMGTVRWDIDYQSMVGRWNWVKNLDIHFYLEGLRF